MGLMVTGPVYDDADFERIRENPEVAGSEKSDYLIILGGCGITAPRRDREAEIARFRDLPCSVLFLDGERDDYDFLDDHPAYPWNGGLAQTVSRGIMRLCRGQVFTIDGLRILTFGGCTTEGRDDVGKYWDWWPDQDPSQEDIDTAISNAGESVDYILSCDCPTSWRRPMGLKGSTPSSEAAEAILWNVRYGTWLFGNLGRDAVVPGMNASAVHSRVIRIS